jgi:hypothetical protein
MWIGPAKSVVCSAGIGNACEKGMHRREDLIDGSAGRSNCRISIHGSWTTVGESVCLRLIPELVGRVFSGGGWVSQLLVG